MSQEIDLQELEAFLSGYWLTDLANFSAFLFANVQDVNWVGFYLSDGKTLRLGPFCGRPACMEIPFEKGICGRAFAQAKTIIVDNVDEFPGHIRCDSDSKSEIVIPVFISKKLIGVLDIDSPKAARFTVEDGQRIENAVQILTRKISTFPGAGYGIIA